MSAKQQILIIVGPTSSGKSALAVQLARICNGEIISADSRQVYRGLDIGTGKITKKEMRGVRHHLIDIASPKRMFTAHDFVKRARAAVSDIARRGKLPIITGGTGFYIDALTGRITLPNVSANRTLRSKLEKKSAAQLFAMLQKRDPQRAETIDRHNMRRLIRALEIADALGKNPVQRKAELYDALWLGLSVPKTPLEQKIRTRLLARLKAGMVGEARRLRAAGVSYKRMHSLGLEYRSLARLLQKQITKTQLVEELATDISRYAKRQRTYWKRNTDIMWLNPREQKKIERTVRVWLRKTS